MLSLKQYNEYALRMISLYQKKFGHLHVSDELIGTVIRYMAKADQKYDHLTDDREKTRMRKSGAIYAIRNYVKEHKIHCSRYKHMGVVFDGVISKEEEFSSPRVVKLVNFLLKNASLDKNEKLVITKYLEGKDYSQIADELNLEYFYVYRSFKNAISKMRGIANV